MAASSADKFKKLTNNFSTTLSAAIVGTSDSSMSLASVTRLNTDTGGVFVIDRVNASGTATPNLREYVVGTVSGSNIINLVRGVGGSTAQAHSTGAVVEQVVDERTINDIIDGILNEHNQDGTHGAVTATSLSVSNGLTVSGGSVTLPNNSIPAAALATSAITLGYSEATSNQTVATTAATDLTNLSTTVTVPAGGRRCEIEVYIPDITSGAADNSIALSIREGATILSTSTFYLTLNKDSGARVVKYKAILSAGSHTFKAVTTHSSATGVDYIMSATSKAYISVEAR